MLDVEKLPEFLNIPPKLLPVARNFNDYKIFIIEGGRGSGKTQSVARILLHIATKMIVRVVCGREIQSTIEESVYTVLSDLITKFTLPFRVAKTGITGLLHPSRFLFKGFREQGSINIKGFEGADVLWVDEAQGVTKPTLDVIMPTLRKENCKIIFTLNRLHRDDAVMELTKRDDCLHIHIDYFDNPHCPLTLLDEAELCRINSPREYNHIWLGQPASSGDEYLFDFDKLYASLEVEPFGELFYRQRIMGIDFAAQGNDSCVATILDRVSSQHWEPTDQVKWDQPDTTLSVGKIIGLINTYKPDVIVLDVGGGGHNVWCDLNAAGIQVHRFDGGSNKGIDVMAFNVRADGYWLLKEWFGHGFLKLKAELRVILKQAEKLRQKPRTDGKRQVEAKQDYKSREGFSPDELDSLMMAVYGAVKFLGKSATSNSSTGMVTRKSGSKRRR